MYASELGDLHLHLHCLYRYHDDFATRIFKIGGLHVNHYRFYCQKNKFQDKGTLMYKEVSLMDSVTDHLIDYRANEYEKALESAKELIK